jgi:pilus assembly protein CpaE
MTALSRAEEKPAPAADAPKQKDKRRIAVVGSRGGVGATTVAINLAWIFAEELKMKTALLDLDLEFGTIALSLDLEPTRGLREALENPGRIDSLFISSALSKLTERLSVLAAEESLGGEVAFNPGAVDVLFEALGQENDCLVIDVPRPVVSVRQRVFQAATRIVLVTELSLPGLRDSIRLLGGIEQVAQDKPITVIANRVGASQQAMQMGDFKKALGRKVDLTIPDDHKALITAANAGKPLVQAVKGSKSAKVLRVLASKLANTKLDEKSEGGLLRFFKKG